MPSNATLSPDPLNFGKVKPGVTHTVQASISFDACLPEAATLAIGAPFSITPTTVAAGETAIVVTVSYSAPTADSKDKVQLTVSGGGTGSFTVKGKVDVTDIITTAEKYLLLQVPDYGETTFESPSTAAGFSDRVLTSFLRLGKFDMDDEPPAAKQLLNLITQVTCATNPLHFDDDGNVRAHASDPNSGSAFQPMKIDDALDAGFVFADDIRDRAQDWDNSVSTDTPAIGAGDDPGHGLTKVQRFTESARLYSRGGWRDHSDGNRISTTFGDKVEVVRGNYKMIVMGRQDDTGQAHGWDVGGDHIQDFAAGTMPGASFWLEWINDKRYQRPALTAAKNPDGTITRDTDGNATYTKSTTQFDQKGVWLLVNTTENVYEYARNAGNFREEAWGDVHETYVGSENPPPDDRAYTIDDVEGTKGHEPPHRISNRNYNYPTTDGNRTTPPWNKDSAGVIRSNPHIIEKTWARRVDSHTGSANCPVPHIEEKTWADKVVERTEIGLGKDTSTLRQDAMTTVHGGVIDNTRVLGWNIGLTSIAGFNMDVTTMGALNLEFSFIGGVSISGSIAALAQIELSGAVGLHFEAYGCLGTHISIDAARLTIEGEAGKRMEMVSLGSTKLVPADEEIENMKTEIQNMKTSLVRDMKFLAQDVKTIAGTDTTVTNNTVRLSTSTQFL